MSDQKDPSLTPVVTFAIAAVAILTWLIYYAPNATQISREEALYISSFNAFMNLLASCCLIVGVKKIKDGDKQAHEKWMKGAFMLSTLFLIGYIAYHSLAGEEKFVTQGLIRPVYFFILISHIILSAISFPMILVTFFLAWKKSWQKHKKWAKWTFPLWLYVCVTGVMIYLFLRLWNHP